MIRIKDVLNELRQVRPVFHSEADFQHALAWTIHDKYSDLNVRLEKRVILNGGEIYLDIFIFNNSKSVAIEVKYKTKNLDILVNSEEFNLKNQDAQDQGRYDFIKDISRLEEATKMPNINTGFAILLTNDESYWSEPSRNVSTADKDFRIHEGKTIKAQLSWKEGTSEGTMSGRKEPITLEGEYILHWKDYSNLEKKKANLDIYL